MGGFDSYCFICGACARCAGAICLPFENCGVDLGRLQPFFLDASDGAFHEDLVSIGPYVGDDDRPLIDSMEIYRGAPEAVRLEAVDPRTIRLVSDLVPGGFHDLGGLGHANPEIDNRRQGYYNVNAAVYPFGHALCFELLKGFTPRLMQPVGNFWMTVHRQNDLEYTRSIEGVDYGDVTGSMEQYVWPYHNYERDEDDEEEDNTGLPRKLLNAVAKDPLDPADIRDFWIGQGKLYVFKRPDQFPIRETFATKRPLLANKSAVGNATAVVFTQKAALLGLPLELIFAIAHMLPMRDSLKLLELDWAFRLRMLPQLDALVKQQLPPWALATLDEKAKWDGIIAEVKSTSDVYPNDQEMFPWWSYAQACWESPSMQNRRRVYGICLQLEAMAQRHYIL